MGRYVHTKKHRVLSRRLLKIERRIIGSHFHLPLDPKPPDIHMQTRSLTRGDTVVMQISGSLPVQTY